MNIQQLEYIVALDDHRHFVSAADACHVTQPTLTMQLKKLEEEIGVQLFDRTKKPLRPTPEGEVFISRARRILLELQNLQEAIKDEQSSIKGEFRLGIIPTLAPHLLPMFLQRFIEENPDTILRIEDMESEAIIKALNDNRLDMAIMATPTGERDLKESVIFNEAFVFYAPETHKLLESETILPEQLDINNLLLLTEGHCFRNQALHICQSNLKKKSIGFHYESGSIETLKSLVRKGLGYTLVPELAINGIDKNNYKRFEYPEPVREISIVTHSSFNRSLLIDRLKSAIRDSLPPHIDRPKEFVRIKWR